MFIDSDTHVCSTCDVCQDAACTTCDNTAIPFEVVIAGSIYRVCEMCIDADITVKDIMERS